MEKCHFDRFLIIIDVVTVALAALNDYTVKIENMLSYIMFYHNWYKAWLSNCIHYMWDIITY